MDYSDDEEGTGPHVRQRKPDSVDHSDARLRQELERLRSLVDVIESEKASRCGPASNCLPVKLNNSVMSTVFGLVFVTIVTVTIYAFHNLYRAIYRRFFQEPESP